MKARDGKRADVVGDPPDRSVIGQSTSGAKSQL